MRSLVYPSESLDDDIYLGFWINRSVGNFRGATLTLDRQRGSLLIACLALFVGATGRSLWKIIRCALHFRLSAQSLTDGVYQQRQAILRNSGLAHEAVIALLFSCHAWRKNGTPALRRTLPLALLAAILSAAFTIAGIFSSRLTGISVNNEVLISGSRCGSLPRNTIPEAGDVLSYVNRDVFSYVNRMVNNYFTYVEQCYQHDDNAPRPAGCMTFTQRNLPYVKDANASCPFEAEICKSKTSNLILDTPFLNSHEHLGLNRGPPFLLRHKIHCAPLVTDGFSEIYVDSSSGQAYQRYNYGRLKENTTFLYQVQLNTTMPTTAYRGDYKVIPLDTENVLQPNFSLIPQLSRSDADTSIFFLDASAIMYKSKTEDPWFSATTVRPYFRLPPDDAAWGVYPEETFIADEPLGVMSCASSRYHCRPDLPATSGCVNLHAKDVDDRIAELWPDPEDQAVVRAWFSVLSPYSTGGMGALLSVATSPSLLAGRTVLGSLQLAELAGDQWKMELEYLYQASLAMMQSRIADFARGYWTGGRFCLPGAECRRMCHSQKLRSSTHYSFSVLGISIVALVGGLVILVSANLERIMELTFKIPFISESQKLRFAFAEWQSMSTLQLQRQAHEGLGLGTWTRATNDVPVTELGDALGVLDVSDGKHPRLVPPAVVGPKNRYSISNGTWYAKLNSTERV